MVEHDDFHSYLLTLTQVKIRTIAAITHTALTGRHDATINPAPNAIAVEQLLQRFMIITLYILLSVKKNVTVEIFSDIC